MTKPGFEAQEDLGSTTPLLIVDKKGTLGADLVAALAPECIIVYASANRLPSSEHKERIVFIPFYKERKKLPKLPSNTYHAIVVVWNGEREIKDSLPEFVTKARNDNAKLVVVTSLSLASHAALSDLLREYHGSMVVLVGDLFPLPGDSSSVITQFLSDIYTHGRVLIAGDGLQKTYPIAREDVTDGIIEVIFGTHRKSRIFFLFPQHPPTELSLARMLQKIAPEIRVDFTKARKERSPILPTEGVYVSPDARHLEKRLAAVVSSIPLGGQKPAIQKGRSKNRFVWRGRYLFASVLFALFLLVLPLGLTTAATVGGVFLLKNAQQELATGNSKGVIQNLSLSHQLFAFAKKSAGVVGIQTHFLGREDVGITLTQSLQTASLLSAALTDATTAAAHFQKVLEGSSQNPTEEFLQATHLLKRCVEGIEQVKAVQEEQPWMQSLLGDQLQSMQPALSMVASVVDVFPHLVGIEGKKTYLVLFQNNMELRPGGGFIGSYGLLTLERGRVKDFNVHDVYDADGQLKGHIEPPFPVRRYMGIVHGYLRDSNFSPDFPTNAKNAAFFLEQETGERVDGVIAVDVTFVNTLLTITGPVYVSDYNETVDAKNFYLLTQSHAEKNFFPGSAQKRQFLTSLFLALQKRLEDKKSVSPHQALEVITQAIREKHILIAVGDGQVQKVLATNNFSSALPQGTPMATTITDFLGISEANVGANKANYYIDRTIAKETTFDEGGTIASVIKILYTNRSTPTSAFGGEYKNYIRLLVPVGATLTGIAVDGQDMVIQPAVTDFSVYEQKRFVPPQGIEVEQSVALGKTIFGFLLPVPVSEKRMVEVRYTLPQRISPDPSLTYSLLLFKQPGTQRDPFSLSLSLPKGYRVIQVSKGGVITRSPDTQWDFPLSTDMQFSIQLAKH